jgi:hypothetical protein
MLSGRLVQLIESNSASIIESMIAETRRDPRLVLTRNLPDGELREWGQYILERLSDWLSAGSEKELATHYELTGRTFFEEGIPLHEAIHSLFLVKESMFRFLADRTAIKTVVYLYAEEELEHRVNRFFDLLVCSVCKGYVTALRRSAQAGAYA